MAEPNVKELREQLFALTDKQLQDLVFMMLGYFSTQSTDDWKVFSHAVAYLLSEVTRKA